MKKVVFIVKNNHISFVCRWSDLLETVKTMLPSKAWNSLSSDLYATFWGLTLYDLYVPRNRYESEIAKQHAALKALEEASDNSSSAITERKKEKEMIQESLDRLTRELCEHEDNVSTQEYLPSLYKSVSTKCNMYLNILVCIFLMGIHF